MNYSFLFLFIIFGNINKGISDVIGGNQNGICPFTITQTYGDTNNIYLPNGDILGNFKENSGTTFISQEETQSDKFFITQTITENSAFNSLTITVKSDNETLLKPTYIMENLDLVSTNTSKVNSIEIIYNCDRFQIGESKIRLLIKPDKCNEFQLIWIKKCKGELIGKPPQINIAFTTKEIYWTILENGNIPSVLNYFFNKEESLITEGENIINSDYIKFIVALADNTNQPIPYKMNPIKLNPNNDKIVTFVVKGEFGNNGGELSNVYREIYILFKCNMEKGMRNDYKLNFEMEFSFDNGQKINVYFTKVCKVPIINFYMRILYMFYYSILLSIVLFFAILFFFFFGSRDEDFSNNDFFFNLKEKIFYPIIERLGLNQYISLHKTNKKNEENNIGISNQITKNNYSNDNEILMDNGDEEEVLSIKFSTENNNESIEENQYGGL